MLDRLIHRQTDPQRSSGRRPLKLRSGQELREEVRVRDQGRLQDHRRVRGVEQLDGVRVLRAAHLRAAHGQVNPEAL